jgi:hypothetical protein
MIYGKLVMLHNFILGVKGLDHKNRNKLDCRRENLRIASQGENTFNASKRKNTTSLWKGVSWNENMGKWVAQIQVNKKKIFLGVFNFEFDAAQAYNFAAEEYFGEFGVFNLPDGQVC